MVKIKIILVDWNYNYISEEEFHEFSEGVPWTEVSTQEYERMKELLKYKHYIKEGPFKDKTIILLTYIEKDQYCFQQFLDKLEEVAKKEIELKNKREEQRKEREKKKEKIALERKKKQLEKLKKELGEND